MQAVILVGIQASGKSTFYSQCFSNTHIRVNLDMLKTRHREKRLIETCLEIGQPFVVDNTNPTPEERDRYIALAKNQKLQTQFNGIKVVSQSNRCQKKELEGHMHDW